jgi:hypothetical protein
MFNMDSHQREFLTTRLREATEKQPELDHLKTLLLNFGGEFLVAPRKPDTHISLLLQHGFLMYGPIEMQVMKSSSCHQNVSTVWMNRASGIVGIATGYALSDDGLWRQHSWGVLRDGVLETTEARQKYFGILLQGKAADNFAQANAPK